MPEASETTVNRQGIIVPRGGGQYARQYALAPEEVRGLEGCEEIAFTLSLGRRAGRAVGTPMACSVSRWTIFCSNPYKASILKKKKNYPYAQ